MNTDDLIGDLADRLDPTPPFALERRLGGLTLIGLLVAAVLMLAWLGMRPDMAAASLTAMFWVKFAYAAALSASGAWAVLALGRPAGQGGRAFGLAGGVFALLALAGVARYLGAPAQDRHALTMGHSALVCPWCIVAISLPLLAAALWALRGMAPTRPMLAGAAAGLMAGGAGAFVYAFHCDESAAPFIALWYTAGVVGSGAVGALAGRFALRW